MQCLRPNVPPSTSIPLAARETVLVSGEAIGILLWGFLHLDANFHVNDAALCERVGGLHVDLADCRSLLSGLRDAIPESVDAYGSTKSGRRQDRGCWHRLRFSCRPSLALEEASYELASAGS